MTYRVKIGPLLLLLGLLAILPNRLQSQNDSLLGEFEAYLADSASLGSFVGQLLDLEAQLSENTSSDSLLAYDDDYSFLEVPKNGKPTRKKPTVLNLTDDQRGLLMSFSEWDSLPTINKLKDEGKLKVYSRGIASNIDPLPRQSQDLSRTSELYLETIRQRISEYSDRIEGLQFAEYYSTEQAQRFTTVYALLDFRMKFLLWMYEKYHIPD